MSKPWEQSKQAGKAVAKEDVQDEGRAYRAPRPHVTRTTEKNPGLFTKIPTAVYERGSEHERATMRSIVKKEVEEMEKKSEERKAATSAKRAHEEVLGTNKKGKLRDEDKDAGAGSHSGVLYNRRGQRVPEASPEGLLTGDRDGSEHAKVLVSPVSHGRTHRLRREILHL
jgi:hypothetical protein